MSNIFEEDELTTISELTENSFENNADYIQHKEEINTRLYNELCKLTSDNLKEKCKSYNLSFTSKSKKQELVNLLVSEFNNHWNMLKDYNKSNLKQICKDNKLKGFATAKKDKIILCIMNYYADNLIINTNATTTNATTTNATTTNATTTNAIVNVSEEVSFNIIDELERQKKEIEKKMIDELERQKAEVERKQKEEDERKQKEKEEDERKQKEEKRRKKQAIPKNVRNIVWNHYIGEDIIKHKCLCCKKVTITNTNFEVGHVISEKNEGTHEINNLRPICGACNHSMGTENMIDFVVKYGLYIG
jgi:5-methylcytosine-specific restriction endonuclease McrA